MNSLYVDIISTSGRDFVLSQKKKMEGPPYVQTRSWDMGIKLFGSLEEGLAECRADPQVWKLSYRDETGPHRWERHQTGPYGCDFYSGKNRTKSPIRSSTT